jgi:hypothetical protein
LRLDVQEVLESGRIRYRLGVDGVVQYEKRVILEAKNLEKRRVLIVIGVVAEIDKGMQLLWKGREVIQDIPTPNVTLAKRGVVEACYNAKVIGTTPECIAEIDVVSSIGIDYPTIGEYNFVVEYVVTHETVPSGKKGDST